jgi:ATP-dependent RNA helicase RhlE
LDQVEVLVLDEADRMLDMGFIVPIRKITSKIPANRQTLLFSATMPDAIAGLAGSLLRDPVRVAITPQATTVERVEQRLMTVSASAKRQLLCHVLADEAIYQALVFTRTKRGADRVAEELGKHKIDAAAIHGNKSQGQRERALALFRSGALRVLVATDIAARGLDIPGVSHVINYELPDEPESYVHRIGRTARAGREGVAIAFCSPDEREQLRDIEKIIGMHIPVDNSQPFHLELAPLGHGGPSRPANMRNRAGGGHGQGPRGHASRPAGGGQHSFGSSHAPRVEARRGPADANGERLSAPAGISNRPGAERPRHAERSRSSRGSR